MLDVLLSAGLVAEVTDDKNLPKQERKNLQIEHAPHTSPRAKLIKLADKLYNLRDLNRWHIWYILYILLRIFTSWPIRPKGIAITSVCLSDHVHFWNHNIIKLAYHLGTAHTPNNRGLLFCWSQILSLSRIQIFALIRILCWYWVREY